MFRHRFYGMKVKRDKKKMEVKRARQGHEIVCQYEFHCTYERVNNENYVCKMILEKNY